MKQKHLMEYRNKYMRLAGLSDTPKKQVRLYEWSFIPNTLEEDGEDDNDMNAPQDSNMNQPPIDNGNEQNMDNQQNPQGDMGNELPQDEGMPIGDEPNSMDSQPPMPMPQDAPIDDEQNSEEDADELDITQLTDAQETMNKKINKVGKGLNNTDSMLNKLMQSLSKISNIIDSNNKKIEDLNQEIKKRNPTPLEKLDLRSVESSKPYNIRPNDYWDEKLSTLPNYTSYDENNPNSKDKKEEYTITTDDINNYSDSDIYNSFKDVELDLKKIFGV